MKNIVRVVERILETFADSIERFSMLFLGKGSDGEFALYEFDGTGLREFDDREIQEVVPRLFLGEMGRGKFGRHD